MDHAGAVVGPLLASLFLWCYPEHYRTLFALTLIPGVIAVLMLLPVPEAAGPPPAVRQDRSAGGFVVAQDRSAGGFVVAQDFSPANHHAVAPDLGSGFYRYLGVVLLFSLGNSTDAFLLLRLSDVGVGAAWIPIAWAALHVVKAAVSPIGGHLSDRLSRRGIIATGWLVYAAVYGGFAMATSPPALVALFLVYGVYYGLTEGVEKAVVADFAPVEARGTAFGAYHAVIGIGALAASLLFGLIWKLAGAPAAFAVGAALALVSAALLSRLRLSCPSKSS
jgi:MFS family permease